MYLQSKSSQIKLLIKVCPIQIDKRSLAKTQKKKKKKNEEEEEEEEEKFDKGQMKCSND
jgi:hypothetical protein